MELAPPLSAVHAPSVQPLEDSFEGPRAPLTRQVSLDEERRDECHGHWRGSYAEGEDAERGVRLFRALLLQHLRREGIRLPPCASKPSEPDPRGWWNYWKEWRALERAARKFYPTSARRKLKARADRVPLLSLDEVAFEDIMQELCQECSCMEQRALYVLWFLCEVCGRAVRVGGWCRAADWAARHVALCATPWACRYGGWGPVVERIAGPRTEENAFLAGAAAAALLALILYCRMRLRHALI